MPLPATTTPYPSLPQPNFGPKPGSITFKDTDPGATIGGELTMIPAAKANAAGITTYMIHWGLEVGSPERRTIPVLAIWAAIARASATPATW